MTEEKPEPKDEKSEPAKTGPKPKGEVAGEKRARKDVKPKPDAAAEKPAPKEEEPKGEVAAEKPAPKAGKLKLHVPGQSPAPEEEKSRPEAAGEKPKPKDPAGVSVDEGWKAQAEAEKRKLAEQEKAAAPVRPSAPRQAVGAGTAGAAVAGPAEAAEARELPEASFVTLVSRLVTQILYALGAFQDPRTGERYRDLALAKHHIDTLAVLEEKTKGNLTEEEKKLLDNALYEVRMAYVNVAQGGN